MAESAAAQVAEPRTLRAFSAYGLEIEYMLVRAATLATAPEAPAVLRRTAAACDREPPPQEAAAGELAWSNELASHVLELKNREPQPLESLPKRLQAEVHRMNRRIAPLGLRLMPGGMHPWMQAGQAQLWSHGHAFVYQAYDRIFGCRAHGWVNVQSTQVNLPFRGDREFARLHQAVRLVLPLIPAIAASSPFADARAEGPLDVRMVHYRHHGERVPSMVGEVVPDMYDSRAEYQEKLLRPMYRDIARFDTDGVLQHEWLNARGAIARFDRGAIEIRVMDAQECPGMDVALAALVIDAVRALYCRPVQRLPTALLARALAQCAREGERARLASAEYLHALGIDRHECRADDAWRALAGHLLRERSPQCGLWEEPFAFVLERGTLARRLLRAAGDKPERGTLREVYSELCDCLDEGRRFDP
jgi:gamma-glutamyl:cysteine ligase YbdK (ATP-grasp superfamily)